MARFGRRELRDSKGSLHWAMVAACTLALAACEAEEPPVNAAQQSNIDNALEEVNADQARSDINVAEVRASESLERRIALEKQEAAADDSK